MLKGKKFDAFTLLDLERFFDTVSHSKLIEILSRTIKDGRVISLSVITLPT